ncbi:YdcF family protein [Alsobacter soli]|nr:YdcF family protein [Alsobacter soli]
MLRLARNLTITACLLAGCALVGGFMLFVQSLARSEPIPVNRVEGIVALTGGSERISDAVDLLARGKGDRLLITGVNGKTTKEEIARQRPDLRSVFDCCVDLDYQALNTVGNAVQTRNWARRHGFRRLLVVTSTYHMPRTLAELGHAMPEGEFLPHPVVADRLDLDGWWREPGTMKLLALEYVKFVAAVTRIGVGAPDPERATTASGGPRTVSALR